MLECFMSRQRYKGRTDRTGEGGVSWWCGEAASRRRRPREVGGGGGGDGVRVADGVSSDLDRGGKGEEGRGGEGRENGGP
jgi:hypothetical protein